MHVQGTRQEPTLEQLLPEGSREFIVSKTEGELKDAAERIKAADTELTEARSALHKAQKAQLAAAQRNEPPEGARPGVYQVGTEGTASQAGIGAAGQRVRLAELNAQLLRTRERDLKQRLARAKRGVAEVLTNIVESRSRRITFGGGVLTWDNTYNQAQYARQLRALEQARKADEARDRQRLEREAAEQLARENERAAAYAAAKHKAQRG